MIPQKGTIFLKEVSTLDCAIYCPKKGVKGMTWIVDVYLTGLLDKNHFVTDFGIAKKSCKSTLDEFFDHVLILPALNPNVKIVSESPEKIKLTICGTESGEWIYEAPTNSILLLEHSFIDIDFLGQIVAQKVRANLPQSVDQVSVILRQEIGASDAHFFHYTHGLAGHQGQCQRLLHGHRSKLEILVDHKKSPHWEEYVINELWQQSVHIATKTQCPIVSHHPIHQEFLSYQSSQGFFSAYIPKKSVYFIDPETSIESIAAHLFCHLKTKLPDQHLKITIYEGLNKGSIMSD